MRWFLKTTATTIEFPIKEIEIMRIYGRIRANLIADASPWKQPDSGTGSTPEERFTVMLAYEVLWIRANAGAFSIVIPGNDDDQVCLGRVKCLQLELTSDARIFLHYWIERSIEQQLKQIANMCQVLIKENVIWCQKHVKCYAHCVTRQEVKRGSKIGTP